MTVLLALAVLAAAPSQRADPRQNTKAATRDGQDAKRAVATADVARLSSNITSASIRPPARPRWPGPQGDLRAAPIYSFALAPCGVDNRRAIENLLAWLRKGPKNEYAVALIPGSSEALCHHCSWTRNSRDPHWVEPNFRSRLRHAFLLLLEGIVHTVVISGGSIDKEHKEYNEAIFGLREMVSEYGARFKQRAADGLGDRIEDRLIVDPWAIHSEVNVRNADRLTRLLGLDRNLIVTEVGSIKRQGWYFVNHNTPFAFDHRTKGQFGFEFGEFEELGKAPVLKRYAPKSVLDRNGVRPAQYLNSAGSHPEIEYVPKGVDTAAIAHWKLPTLQLLMDSKRAPRWDVAEKEAKERGFKPLPPDLAAVGRSCSTLKRR